AGQSATAGEPGRVQRRRTEAGCSLTVVGACPRVRVRRPCTPLRQFDLPAAAATSIATTAQNDAGVTTTWFMAYQKPAEIASPRIRPFIASPRHSLGNGCQTPPGC